MKKYLFLGIAATAMLASCTNNEVVEMNPQNAIGFEAFVDKSTRATDVTTENLKEFNVWAYQGSSEILKKEVVSNSVDAWSYTNTQYWINDQTYNFYAVAPVDANIEYTGASGAMPTIAFENDGETDLIFAKINNVKCENAAAMTEQEFTFVHLLSRVRFKFIEDFNNEKVKVIISDVRIENVDSEATYGNGWYNHAKPSTYNFTTQTQESDGFTSSLTSEHMYLIPNNSDNAFTIKFGVKVTQAGVELVAENTKTINATVNLAAQKSYELTISINEGNAPEGDEEIYPIEFSVEEVNSWEGFLTENATIQ